MKSRTALAVTFAPALMLAACGGADEGDKADPVALVSLAHAQQGAVDETLTLYGQVENGAVGRRVLAAPTEGVVIAIEAPAGTKVSAGQVVARLAPSAASKLDLTKAGTDSAAAQAALARALRLRADGLVSDAEVETARAASRTAGATRASLGQRSGGLVLRAPVSGHVETVAFVPGDIVPAGTTVASISANTELRVRFGIDPALATRVGPGSILHITAPGGVPVSLPVQSVDPVVDPTTKLAAVFATLPQGTGVAGNSAISAQLSLATGAGLTVPYAALLDDAGQPYVYVIGGGAAHRREVKIGPVDHGRVAITGGLKPDEAVVVAGNTALEDGMKVRTR